MGDEAPTDAELVHAYRARNLPSWLLLQTARAKHDDVPTFRVRNAIRKLEKTDTYPPCGCACSRPWEAMYRALLRRFTELVEELDKITKAHNDLYAHFLDDDE